VIARTHAIIETSNLAGFVDQHTHTFRVAIRRTPAGAASQPELATGIAYQGKTQGKFLRESRILLNRVETRADYRDIQPVEVGFLVAEPATFERSAGGIGLGIEPNQHLASAQIA
jgi:hypothetical protein